MKIILDANILISDYFLKGTSINLLLRYLDRIPAQLSIPEIVIDEVINKYREDMYQLNNDIQKLNKDYRRLSNVDSNLISIDIKKAIDEYRQFLDAFI